MRARPECHTGVKAMRDESFKEPFGTNKQSYSESGCHTHIVIKIISSSARMPSRC